MSLLCSICRKALFPPENGFAQPIMSARCGHLLHNHCLESYLKVLHASSPQKISCPYCKQKVSSVGFFEIAPIFGNGKAEAAGIPAPPIQPKVVEKAPFYVPPPPPPNGGIFATNMTSRPAPLSRQVSSASSTDQRQHQQERYGAQDQLRLRHQDFERYKETEVRRIRGEFDQLGRESEAVSQEWEFRKREILSQRQTPRTAGLLDAGDREYAERRQELNQRQQYLAFKQRQLDHDLRKKAQALELEAHKLTRQYSST